MNLSWGHRIAIVYTTFAVATIGFVVFAIGETVEVVRPDYYEESLHRDERARDEHNAAALGDSASLQVEHRSIRIALPPRFAGTTVDVVLYRPSAAAEDDTVRCTVGPDGQAAVDMRTRATGRWDVRATWSDGIVDYSVERKLTIGVSS